MSISKLYTELATDLYYSRLPIHFRSPEKSPWRTSYWREVVTGVWSSAESVRRTIGQPTVHTRTLSDLCETPWQRGQVCIKLSYWIRVMDRNSNDFILNLFLIDSCLSNENELLKGDDHLRCVEISPLSVTYRSITFIKLHCLAVSGCLKSAAW